MFLVVARAPTRADVLVEAARLTGLALADVRQRLAGVLPRVLLTDAHGDAFAEIARSLEPLGFLTFTCDARLAPNDGDRLLARGLELGADALRATDAGGGVRECPWRSIELVQRALRVTTASKTGVVKERRFAPGAALLTGGLIMSKKVERQVVTKEERRELFAVLHRDDGEPDIALYERGLDYRFLGATMQPTSRGNFEAMMTALATRLPTTPVDDRPAQQPFLLSLPRTSVDSADLALFMVALARAREGATPYRGVG